MSDVIKGNNNILQGIIIKSIGGLYAVESSDSIYECRARGIFRNLGISPCVGDVVKFDAEEKVIKEVVPRRNSIVRPPLANIDQIIFVVSMCRPSPNLTLLDKFIAISRFKGIECLIALTKVDLETFENIFSIYTKIGIKVFVIDYTRENPAQELLDVMIGKVNVFTGNTGVGKSTLLNSIDNTLNIATGEISEKLGRGRHTTRHAQLYKIKYGGYVADTPGFSTFDTNKYDIIRKEQLAECFQEFEPFLSECRFKDCSHTAEKGCAIIEAVDRGDIARSRYNSYLEMYEEAKKLKEWEI